VDKVKKVVEAQKDVNVDESIDNLDYFKANNLGRLNQQNNSSSKKDAVSRRGWGK